MGKQKVISAFDMGESAEPPLPSNRRFAFVLGAIFVVVGVLKRQAGGVYPVVGIVGGLLILAGIFFPEKLSGLNRSWAKLGLLMGRLVNPIVLGLLFYLVISPLGILARMLGFDFLKLKRWCLLTIVEDLKYQ